MNFNGKMYPESAQQNVNVVRSVAYTFTLPEDLMESYFTLNLTSTDSKSLFESGLR